MKTLHLIFFTVLITLMFLATGFSAPTADVIVIPNECRGKRYCAIKPKNYELLVPKMDAIMKQFMSGVTLSGVVAGRRIRKSKVRSVFDPSQMRTFEMPKACKEEGRQFCFDNDNYPIDIIEDLLKDVTGLVVADKDSAVEVFESYADREGSPFDYDCRATSNSSTIYYIVDEAGRDRVVVQLEGRFEQEFSVKWCDKEGSISGRTDHFMRNVVNHHKMYCQNKYMHYDFLVLSTEPGYDGKWRMEKARTKMGIPVCCMCRYDKKI